MIDIYANWIKDFDITGFRLDTVKHVNNEFWQSFIPAIQEAAQKSGRKDFFIFGEVYDPDPAFLSEFVHRASMPSVLDFGFQRGCAGIRVGHGSHLRSWLSFLPKMAFTRRRRSMPTALLPFLETMIWGESVTFYANDVGSASNDELLGSGYSGSRCAVLHPRDSGNLLWRRTRVSPAREGTSQRERICLDQRCRIYAQEKRIGGGDGSAPAFNEDHPLFRAIREMIIGQKAESDAATRHSNCALRG